MIKSIQSVNLRSHDEVAFGQTVDLVRPERDFHAAPGEINVRMMTLLFREFADFVGEGERFAKVFEGKVFLQVMAVYDLPMVAQLPLQLSQRLSLQGRNSAFARDTILFRKFTHNIFNGRTETTIHPVGAQAAMSAIFGKDPEA